MELALVFPGQGSQYVGMGKDIYDNTEAKSLFERANDILGYNISEVCFNGPEEELQKTSVTQPAILVTSIALYREFQKGNKIPVKAVAGHSLGEYSALVAAESLDFEDAVQLVERRGRFMAETSPKNGGMAAVLGLDRKLTEEACKTASTVARVEIANYNCPGQIVISGTIEGINRAAEICTEMGAKKVIPLKVSGPFHSSLVEPAQDRLAAELNKININEPAIPFINNVEAKFVSDTEKIKELLIKQVSHSVLWEDIVQEMISEGIDTFVEIGPGKVLKGLIRKIDRRVKVFNVENITSLENTLAKLGEVI